MLMEDKQYARMDDPALFSIVAQEMPGFEVFGLIDKKPCFSSAKASGTRASRSSFFLSDIFVIVRRWIGRVQRIPIRDWELTLAPRDDRRR
jgi:hypothetical protein